MVFVDPFFLIVFLPLVLAAFYWLTPRLGGNAGLALLLAASILFYVKFGVAFCALLLTSIAVNFAVGAYLVMTEDAKESARKAALALGQAWNFGALVYFKYWLYIGALLTPGNGAAPGAAELAIPVGISFYTFHQAVFLMDAYAKKSEVVAYLGDLSGALGRLRAGIRYAAFICFFPQLVIGPIVYMSEFAPSVDRKGFGRFKRTDLEVGLTLVLIGLAKKLVIADRMAPMAANLFSVTGQGAVADPVTAWMGVLAYFLQLYFDFSGYSDMAVGLARMLGVRLPINFDSPLRATGIIDFYKRWHITLTRVIARFLFTPLAMWGTRKAMERRMGRLGQKALSSWLPLLVNFQIIALWHGALATFLVFGLIHGIWYIIETEVRASKRWKKWAKTQPDRRLTVMGQAITVLPLVLTFALFASPDLKSYGLVLQSLFTLSADTSAMAFHGREWALIAAGFAIVWLLPNSTELTSRYRPGLLSWTNPSTTPGLFALRWRPDLAWGALMVLIIAAGIYSQSQKAPFLYQGF